MKHLTIVRHGEFTAGEAKLNAVGIAQMNSVLVSIRHQDPLVYSSVGPRAKESAHIIAAGIGKQSEAFEHFGSNSNADESVYYQSAYEFLNKIDDNVIVFTKGEWIANFVPYFCKRALGLQIEPITLKRGESVQIDCITKEISIQRASPKSQ